jgi:uncharacterized damage-inducible protein DinB
MTDPEASKKRDTDEVLATSSGEREVLLARLEAQRRHILEDLEGLSEEALRRAVLPSGWTCLGLVGHLTNDVERFWFRCVVGGAKETIEATMSVGNAWNVDPEVRAADVLAAYQDEIARANAVIASCSLNASPLWWPEDLFGSWRLDSVREVLLHVIVETATHAGQLDAVRELIDGRQWVVLT